LCGVGTSGAIAHSNMLQFVKENLIQLSTEISGKASVTFRSQKSTDDMKH